MSTDLAGLPRYANCAVDMGAFEFQAFPVLSTGIIPTNPTICSGSIILKADTGKEYIWSTGATSVTIVVGNTGPYSVTITHANNCTSISNTIVSLGTLMEITNLQYSNSISPPNCSVNLTATASGTTFVFTGPNGYVYSNVYRIPGTYQVFATNVREPGLYTLTASSNDGCKSEATINVQGTACKP